MNFTLHLVLFQQFDRHTLPANSWNCGSLTFRGYNYWFSCSAEGSQQLSSLMITPPDCVTRPRVLLQKEGVTDLGDLCVDVGLSNIFGCG